MDEDRFASGPADQVTHFWALQPRPKGGQRIAIVNSSLAYFQANALVVVLCCISSLGFPDFFLADGQRLQNASRRLDALKSH